MPSTEDSSEQEEQKAAVQKLTPKQAVIAWGVLGLIVVACGLWVYSSSSDSGSSTSEDAYFNPEAMMSRSAAFDFLSPWAPAGR